MRSGGSSSGWGGRGAALAERGHVSAIDVLLGIGWPHQRRVGEWRQGRVDQIRPAGRAIRGRSRAQLPAVAAAVRYQDTAYDELLMSGMDRGEAREVVRGDVSRVLDGWVGEAPDSP